MKRFAFHIKVGLFFFLSLVIFSKSSYSDEAQSKIISIGITHIHTSISDGEDTPEVVLKKAIDNKIGIVIFTDWFLRRWEYGIWPFRNLIKRRVEFGSVVGFRAEKYLAKIKNLQMENPNLIILPGVEVVPFYYWQGIPFDISFCMYDWHKRFLVIGLEDPIDYHLLPVVSSRRFRLSHIFQTIFRLWWAILFAILGLSLARRRQFRIVSKVIIVFGILFLINGSYFNTSRYNQYQYNLGVRPYQDFIEYVNRKGGMCFWVDPDSQYLSTLHGINIITYAHSEALQLTDGYTGFSLSSLGRQGLVEPNSRWDSVLLDYCEGTRKRPIWVIGGLDYERSQDSIDIVKTVFLLPSLTKENVLHALRDGNMYVDFKTGESKFDFGEFRIVDTMTEKSAHIGERLIRQGNPKILINCTNPSYTISATKIDLIKNGQLIKTFTSQEENIYIEYEDTKPKDRKASYYRLKISARGKVIYTNPIFVI